MLKNSPEKPRSPESKEDFDKIIKHSLAVQLDKMRERSPGRSDIKFKVLEQFVSNLEKQSFKEAFENLSEPHKHAIITRLKNEAKHMGGSVPYDFIKILEQKLYGVISDEDGEIIDFNKKVELEKQLQSENSEN